MERDTCLACGAERPCLRFYAADDGWMVQPRMICLDCLDAARVAQIAAALRDFEAGDPAWLVASRYWISAERLREARKAAEQR